MLALSIPILNLYSFTSLQVLAILPYLAPAQFMSLGNLTADTQPTTFSIAPLGKTGVILAIWSPRGT
ncbi:hypothetical protein B0H10DRAFT_1980809 [Mycena sp. CBHHK59/15]|nr:hypothetical protein B0H10DRAFT_1980809 [Mycena sp. CBHHK59/15]